MWPRTDFLDLLAITHPIIQAPMSGFTPPALVAAVCNEGGLGSIGCVGRPPDVVRDEAAAVRQVTNRPFNLNFFVHKRPRTSPAATAASADEASTLLRRIWAGAGACPERTVSAV
jgi:nitronate monooxygenase